MEHKNKIIPHDYNDNQSNELLVPALKFPILNLGGDVQYWRKSIIVPLAKELFEQQLPQPLSVDDAAITGGGAVSGEEHSKLNEETGSSAPEVESGEPEGASIEEVPMPKIGVQGIGE